MATEVADWDTVEEVLVWVEAMEEVVGAMVSHQEVEATEEESCTGEVWVEAQGPLLRAPAVPVM